ncbi:putative histidine triad protein member [Operophtera brumata]|uniref:m7GpppX diphosphatase n=1 Tax=Operophtera brumata TaxID=104452 RepID=A0A0L7LC84_OPEBR|nr:putative histidine triad protein member [Operophtera brumata]
MSDGNRKADDSESPNCKRKKIDKENEHGVSENQPELKDFIVENILNNNTNRKTVCLQGRFREKSGVALVILEKNAFKEEELDESGYFSVDTELRTFFQNDIYGNFECFPRSSINATEKHISKFSQQILHIILETPELYEKLTLPHIQKEQFTLQVPGTQLRIYLHYQPSFYHLHIHFTYLRHEAPGIHAEKAHLLDSVIDNIQMMGDYYQKASLPFTIREMDNIFNFNDRKTRRDSLSSIESLSDYSDDEKSIEETAKIPIQEFCQIIPNSMSCLKIDKDTISFRLLTEPENGGNFYNELLAPNTTVNNKGNDLKVNVTVGIDIVITCGNCSNVISNAAIKFDRVLELPSENLDMSEWFCHGHCHGNSDHTEIVLKPNKMDFLYRLTYFLINSSLLSDKTNKFNLTRDVYHCNRCLAWLGLKNKDMIKLFNSEIIIQEDSVEKRVFSYNTSVGNKPTDDFIFTVESMIKEFDLGLQYTIMCKIVLECSVSANKKQYLLIWVMDKELQVLRVKTQIVTDKIELQSSSVTKLLYKVEQSLSDEVESWLADPAVVSSDVSKSMFNSGIEHLQEMSLKVPESFRYTNGFF